MARDNRCDAARECRRSIGLAVISLVRHHNARTGVGADVEPRLELYGVAYLAVGQVEVERVAVEIGLEVDFGRETAARAAERLAMAPPFVLAAETWARAVVLSNNCTRCAVWLHSTNNWKKASNTLGAAELWTASRNLRSTYPGSPRLDCAASSTSSTSDQSRSVIAVSMSGSQMPVTR